MFDFRRFRKEKKLRQDYFVKLFECTQGYISQLENKIKPITDDQLALLRTRFDDIDKYITKILPENTNETIPTPNTETIPTPNTETIPTPNIETISTPNTETIPNNKFYEELILSQQRTIEAQTKIILDMQTQLKNVNAPRSDATCANVAG